MDMKCGPNNSVAGTRYGQAPVAQTFAVAQTFLSAVPQTFLSANCLSPQASNSATWRNTLNLPLLSLLLFVAFFATPLLSIGESATDTNTPATPVAPVAPVAPPTRAIETLDAKQKLAVGDRVTFQVMEDQEDPKPLIITDSGEINIPELGLVQATGKTCKQLAAEIKEKLEQTTYFHANVILGIELLNKTISGRKVFVVGQVRVTGPQEIPAGETWTVSKVILRAGGFTDFADKKHVRLIRGGGPNEQGKLLVVNVNEIWEKANTAKDLPVEPEDLVYVPTRAVNFR